jgi:peptidyl-dipeptidase Dcp
VSDEANPFFEIWDQPFGLPPFARIETEHFAPAFERAMTEHNAEIAAIALSTDAPTFTNTIEALERAGAAMTRVGGVFWNLVSTDATPALQAVERDISPKLATHYSTISLDPALFARVESLWTRRADLGLDAETLRVLELTFDGFVRSGARLGVSEKRRYAEIVERLATLGTTFSQNVLADEAQWLMELDGESDLAGLPDSLRAGAERTATERGLAGKHAISLSRSSIEPFLNFSSRRDLRARAFEAWTRRGENAGEHDNRPIIAEIVSLREEMAHLLGFQTYAHYKLDDKMAHDPASVRQLLHRVWEPAKAKAAHERRALQEIAQREGDNAQVTAADWRFYAEKARREFHDIDEALLRPFFALDNMIAAAFDVAGKLFGLTFTEQPDLALYHPDARAFEVRDRNGAHLALFVADYFARPTKRSGAWMSAFRRQNGLDGTRPIITNVMNFAQGVDGQPTLIGLDDARTLFHEFGHALHGMLSQTRYPSIAGTSVATDFVEFPSQLYEHWLMQPEVLSRFALHWQTGEPLPETLVAKVIGARNFNQGFATVEYCASAIVDLDLHLLSGQTPIDVVAFEKETLEKAGMPDAIVPRHRAPHFSHVFSGGHYAAGYYSYLWSEVLDADGFRAFKETGDIFDPATARRLETFVYSAGAKETPEAAWMHFRGRAPDPEALLEKRDLV